MRILVIDDSSVNLEAARTQLAGHEVVMASSYDLGRDLLTGSGKCIREKVLDLLWSRGIERPKKPEWHLFESNEKWEEAQKAYDEAERAWLFTYSACAKEISCFEVVLCDLMMPPSQEEIKEELRGGLFGKEMPVGIFLALAAAARGAKYVGLLTDSSHHDHPASACLDAFHPVDGESKPKPFTLNGAKVILSNNRNWIIGGEYDHDPANKGKRVKNWAALLDYLLNEE